LHRIIGHVFRAGLTLCKVSSNGLYKASLMLHKKDIDYAVILKTLKGRG